MERNPLANTRARLEFQLLIVVLIAMIAIAVVTVQRVMPDRPCYEDMACWNCETMGNRVCGSR